MNIEAQKITEAINFIRNSVFELQENCIDNERIEILMPLYFQDFIVRDLKNLSAVCEAQLPFFEGFRVLNNYEHAIVVYDKMWNPLRPQTAKKFIII